MLSAYGSVVCRMFSSTLAKREILVLAGLMVVGMAPCGWAQERLCCMPEQSHVLYQIKRWTEIAHHPLSVLRSFSNGVLTDVFLIALLLMFSSLFDLWLILHL